MMSDHVRLPRRETRVAHGLAFNQIIVSLLVASPLFRARISFLFLSTPIQSMPSTSTSNAPSSSQYEGGSNPIPTQTSVFEEGQRGKSGSQTVEKTSLGGETHRQYTVSGSNTASLTPTFSGAHSSSTAEDLKAREHPLRNPVRQVWG
ncbi:hypothetical protein H0H93_007816 [Arthromyces matolae]|nr:hypothetical protein H0H93_007816 [Arthromyces matolae]